MTGARHDAVYCEILKRLAENQQTHNPVKTSQVF